MYEIRENRLQLDDAVRAQFVVPHQSFGSAIAYSQDTLIVFDDEAGTKVLSLAGVTFRYLAGKFFIWKDQLFHLAHKLGKMRPEKVRGFTKHFVWDDQTVYYRNGVVGGADPTTFRPLGFFWAKDGHSCFFQADAIPGADPLSFRAIARDFAVDSQSVFGFLGKVLASYSRDPRSLGRGYFEVSGQLFFGSRSVAGADLATFRVLPRVEPSEKRRIWASGGPKDDLEALAVSGFTAVDAARKYRGEWNAPRVNRA